MSFTTWAFVLCAAALIPVTSAQAQPSTRLHADVLEVIQKQYSSPDKETRYLDASTDLNADGQPEVIVYVVGGFACGTGGCPTLVFTHLASGYRLLSAIGLSHPPIRATSTVSNGWRNLIVHVGGGGATPQDVELQFDGKTYPGNPTMSSSRAKTTTNPRGEVLIRPLASFEEAKRLPAVEASGAPPAREPGAPKPAAAGPSFDCGKAALPVERFICGDAALASLDRQLADAYTTAMKNWTAASIRTEQQGTQRKWLESRNACAKAGDVRSCLEASYRRRVIEVQITSGQLAVPQPVGFECAGQNEPFTVTFYKQTDPPSAAMTFGDQQVIALAVRSGSGTRYTAPGVDFWEHQGEARVTWGRASFICKPAE